jgi:hypothetical protein
MGCLKHWQNQGAHSLSYTTNVLVVYMSKSDRLSRIIQVYLAGDLELGTAVAEVTHVYVERGWRFVLIESQCQPRYRERMRLLATRVHAELRSESVKE